MNFAQATQVTTQTAEGVTSCAPVLELARKHGVEMPITEVIAAVITGGSKGLGLAMATEFAASGADVAILARNPDALGDHSPDL